MKSAYFFPGGQKCPWRVLKHFGIWGGACLDEGNPLPLEGGGGKGPPILPILDSPATYKPKLIDHLTCVMKVLIELLRKVNIILISLNKKVQVILLTKLGENLLCLW